MDDTRAVIGTPPPTCWPGCYHYHRAGHCDTPCWTVPDKDVTFPDDPSPAGGLDSWDF